MILVGRGESVERADFQPVHVLTGGGNRWP
jgi:hypothetical protein